MTNAEAIETLRANYPDCCFEQLRAAVDKAIKVLEAQDATGDSISRQAAIDAADRADYTGLAVEDVKKVTDEVVKELKRLPSAQPEIIRCKDCKWCKDADGLMCKNPASWVVATECDFGCVLAERRTDERSD